MDQFEIKKENNYKNYIIDTNKDFIHNGLLNNNKKNIILQQTQMIINEMNKNYISLNNIREYIYIIETINDFIINKKKIKIKNKLIIVLIYGNLIMIVL